MTVEQVWRTEAPHVLAALTRRYGDFGDCEDAVQEALLAAAAQWPREGMPHDPRAWLITVAQRRLIDQVRSESARRRREERYAADALDGAAPVGVDDSLEVLLLCAHPALTKASQVALILRAVSGLTTAQIAAGFLVPEATIAARITRARKTLAGAGSRFPAPAADLSARVGAVRHALALLHTEGHVRSSGAELSDAGFSGEAIRLARSLWRAVPADPENAGLLALLLLTHARGPARTDAHGDLVPLEAQDRSRWRRDLIAEGVAILEAVLPVGPVGEFQLQAAIAAVHDEAASWAATDWPQIAELYRMLDLIAPGEAVTIGRAVAVARTEGPAAGLALLDPLAASRNHRVAATRGHLLAELGRTAQARVALEQAARTTRSIPEQRYLNRLLHEMA